MNILVVSAHETPRSLTSALHNISLGVLQRTGHAIAVTELYSQQFNPIASHLDFATSSSRDANYMFEQQRTVNTGGDFSPDLKSEMQKVHDAELLIFHFPLWWSGTPAILKGWIDRVFAMGVAWGPGNRYEKGFYRGKRALVCVSVGDPTNYYTADGMHGATVEQHLYPFLHGTLAFCGFDVLRPYILSNVTAGNKHELETAVEQYRQLLATIATSNDFIYAHPTASV